MTIQVQKGTTALVTFETLDFADGSRVAPDSAPIVEFMHVNGVINDAIVTTVTQMQDSTPANIVGYYRLTFPTSTLTTQDDVHVSVVAEINGIESRKIFHFLVINEPSRTPVIR